MPSGLFDYMFSSSFMEYVLVNSKLAIRSIVLRELRSKEFPVVGKPLSPTKVDVIVPVSFLSS